MTGFHYQRPNGTVRVLQVEDASADAELIIDGLHDEGIECVVHLVDTEQAFLEALDTFAPDIVLSDWSVPGFAGARALELLRDRDAMLPFIFVSGTIGEEVAVAALRQGATDYVLKDNPVRLAPAVVRALREAAEQRSFEQLEAGLMRSQRFESLALLAGGLSHDLRNILQPLLLAADTLADYHDDARLMQIGELVRNCGQRGLEMVSSMLTFARGARQPEQVRIDSLFDAVALLLRGSVPRNIEFKVTEDGAADLQFAGNHTELQQCLLNLCLNAIQAMPEGGSLSLEARRIALQSDFFKPDEAATPGDYLAVSVIDTGMGMPSEVMANLFQPFYTTKTKGTGLGLMSCKRIIESCSGAIRVQSTPGEGSRFSIYMPIAHRTAARPAADLPVGNGERILVVAERAATLSLLGDTLDSYGYTVDHEQSGAAALQALQRDGLPQLVMVDADMTLLSGVRTLEALVEAHYTGAVLLLTRPEALLELDGLPPLPHLRMLNQPVELATLLHSVRESLDDCSQQSSATKPS